MAITISGDSPSFASYQGGVLTAGTAVASTSGTSIDFTGIPSWVKRITVMFNGVSTNGSADFLIQIGAGSVSNTGYLGAGIRNVNGSNNIGLAYTTGYGINNPTQSSSCILHGIITITLVGSNRWVASGVTADNTAATATTAGSITLSGTLDRVRITTSNGTDTFDAGTINILYE